MTVLWFHNKKVEQLEQKIRELEEKDIANQQEIEKLTVANGSQSQLVGSLLQQIAHRTSETIHFSNVRDSLDLIRNQAADSANSLAEEQSKLRETSSLFQQSNMVLEQITQGIVQLGDTTQMSINSVRDLEEATQRINQFTDIITEISNQTNLLALNAAIEAARAGEQGRGFAVVADEVRTLAGKTAEATDEIKEFVSRISNHSEQTRINFDNIAGSMDMMNSSVETVSNVIEEVVQLANNMTHVISHSTAGSFIDTVKLDHVLFKMDIYRSIFGVCVKKPEEFADHFSCRLGQWYYQGEGKKLNHTDAYKLLETPHARVHEMGKLAILDHLNGNHDASISALAAMEKASDDVLLLLDRLSDELVVHMEQNTHTKSADIAGSDTGDIDLF